MFKILTSKPVSLNPIDDEDLTIKEALQTIYPYTKESALYIYWNGYILELWFCAEISDIFKDIMKMLDSLLDKESFEIHWGSNIFFGIWSFTIVDSSIKINSTWTDLRGGKEILDQVKKVSNTLIIDKKTFINEWINLLEQLKNDLINTGYNNENIEDFYLLENLDKYLA